MNSFKKIAYVLSAILLITQNSYSYVDRAEAIHASTSIICNIFSYGTQDDETRAKINEYIASFNQAYFQPDTDYRNMQHVHLAHAVLEDISNVIWEQAQRKCHHEVITFYRNTYDISAKNQQKLPIVVANDIITTRVAHVVKSLKTQIEDHIARQHYGYETTKSVDQLCKGKLENYIGTKLQTVVREKTVAILQRECAIPYCDGAGDLVILDCGHKLHETCLKQLQKSECPLRCTGDLSALRRTKPQLPRLQTVYQQAPQTTHVTVTTQTTTLRTQQQPVAPAPRPQPSQNNPLNDTGDALIVVGIFAKILGWVKGE